MAFPEYESFDAVGLRALITSGEVRPRDLVEAAADRIERRNPKLNAVIRPEIDRAEALAAESPQEQGPLGGVPYLVKDLAFESGRRTAFGSVFFRDYVVAGSSTLVERMTAGGLISMGRTNTPEFGLLPTTEPVLYGSTANPWSLDHSPGGSSGGAAAAVAAGIVPLAHGGDGGGSIRIPAANCGIFGLKPSRGRTPQHPPAASDLLAVDGCVSRTVRDTAAFLDVVAGAVPGSRYAIPSHDRPFSDAVEADPRRLRVVMLTHDFHGNRLHSDCAAAVEKTAEVLAELGHDVEDTQPGFDADMVEDAFLEIWATLAATIFELILTEADMRFSGRLLRRSLGDWRMIKTIARLDKRKSKLDAFEPFTWELARRSRRRTPSAIALADTTLKAASFDFAEFMDGYDVMLTPTLGLPPVRTGAIDQRTAWDDLRAQLFDYVPFTPIANITGRPAMSVPLHWNAEGLPIGSQLIGAQGDDFTLLGLAAQLERARPWFDKLPPIASE